MAGKVGVRNIQPPHRHHDAHVRREPGMGRLEVRFRLPANLLKALWPIRVVPESCLVLALNKLFSRKPGLFFDHRITRTVLGAFGSGPKNLVRISGS